MTTDAVPLYSGDDLEHALERTPFLPNPRADGRGGGGAARAVRTIARHLSKSTRRAALLGCREQVLRGTERRSGRTLVVRYVGTGENLPFVVRACFAEHDVVEEQVLATPWSAFGAAWDRSRGEDCLFVDAGTPLLAPAVRGPRLRLPPWVKQRLALPERWEDLLGSLSRRTRRGVARFLRKYGYEGRWTRAEAAWIDFYERLYAPHVRRRYGAEGVVVSPERFRAECRGGALIQLLHRGEVVGANAVRPAGDTLAIIWCGFSEEVAARDLKGVADVLDYFSMLHAVAAGCTLLDLGPSRPQLNDGALVYKTKWGARLGVGRLPTPPILLVPRNLEQATASMLAANPWITRHGRLLAGRILKDGGPVTDEELGELCERHLHPGIGSLRVCALRGFASGVARRERVRLVDLGASADPLAAYLGEGGA